MTICGKIYLGRISIVLRDFNGRGLTALKMDYSSKEVFRNDKEFAHESIRVEQIEACNTFDSISAKCLNSRHNTIDIEPPGMKF